MTDDVACGASTSVFGHRSSLTPRKIRTLADTGLAYIEIGALQPQHLNIWDEEHIRELAVYMASARLKTWSFHAPFCALAMDDRETREGGVRRLVRSAAVAARFEAPVLVVHPGRDVPSLDREREMNWTVEGMLRAADEIPEGVVLALETMGKECPTGPPEEMAEVMDRLPADRIGVCVDTGHVHQNYDVVAYIGHVRGRIASVHLQDNMGDKDSHLLAGSGSIDFPAALRAFRDSGYDGVWMSEGGDPGLGPEENAREFVRRIEALDAARRAVIPGT
jgi:sugar phosphate isomerase/epimerase